MLKKCVKNKYLISNCKNCVCGNVCNLTKDKEKTKDFLSKVKKSLDKVK